MNKFAAVILAMFLAGCTTATHMRGPDGLNNWVSITCKGSQSHCYDRAATECPNGYIVASNSGSHGEQLIHSDGGRNGVGAFTTTVHTYNGELFIQCK